MAAHRLVATVLQNPYGRRHQAHLLLLGLGSSGRCLGFAALVASRSWGLGQGLGLRLGSRLLGLVRLGLSLLLGHARLERLLVNELRRAKALCALDADGLPGLQVGGVPSAVRVLAGDPDDHDLVADLARVLLADLDLVLLHCIDPFALQARLCTPACVCGAVHAARFLSFQSKFIAGFLVLDGTAKHVLKDGCQPVELPLHALVVGDGSPDAPSDGRHRLGRERILHRLLNHRPVVLRCGCLFRRLILHLSVSCAAFYVVVAQRLTSLT